jgi:hypothetical protein
MLFDPHVRPSLCAIQDVVQTTFLDRDAYEVTGLLGADKASRKRDAYKATGLLNVIRRDCDRERFALGVPYTNRMKLLVDKQTGMLLHLETLADDELYMRLEIQDVVFDEPMDDSLFIGPADAQLASDYLLHKSAGEGWASRLARWLRRRPA